MGAGGTYTSPPIEINDSAVMESITKGWRKRGSQPMRTLLYLDGPEQGSLGFDGSSSRSSELNATIGGREGSRPRNTV